VINVDYELGTPLKIAVQIYDEVRKGSNKSMGSATFDIGEVLGARGSSKARKLKKGGTLFCHIAKQKGSGLLRLGMNGIKLKNTEGFLRKSDPFFELSSKRDGAGGLTWDNMHRSEVIMDNLNPAWKDAIVPLSTLNQGDLSKPILISVYDHESSGKHVLMGSVQTTVKELQSSVGSTLTLKKKSTVTGTLAIHKAEVAGVDEVSERMAAASISAPAAAASYVPSPTAFAPTVGGPSFVDYIGGGCELNVGVAIDFTGSNGDPRKPGTLHYRHPDGSYNDYEKAISAIVGVLSKYDSDQMYPVWGFGKFHNTLYVESIMHIYPCVCPHAILKRSQVQNTVELFVIASSVELLQKRMEQKVLLMPTA
jgi:hypothetical protein